MAAKDLLDGGRHAVGRCLRWRIVAWWVTGGEVYHRLWERGQWLDWLLLSCKTACHVAVVGEEGRRRRRMEGEMPVDGLITGERQAARMTDTGSSSAGQQEGRQAVPLTKRTGEAMTARKSPM
jgi:hypothetical protein